MFNWIYFNQQTFNWPAQGSEPFTDRLQYNSYNFSNTDFRLTRISGLDGVENIKLNAFDIAQGNGEWFSSYWLKRKQIKVEGVMKADTVEDLETAIVSLKAKMLKGNKTFKYNMQDGTTLVTTASCTSIDVKRDNYHINFVPVTLVFTVLDPFLYSQVTQEASYLSKSANYSAILVNSGWSFTAEPMIYFYFWTGLGSVTEVAVTIWDTTITVNETIVDGDVLLIDGKNKEVKINDVWGKDYTGTFPVLDIWSNALSVTVNDTWDADIYVTWYDTYA